MHKRTDITHAVLQIVVPASLGGEGGAEIHTSIDGCEKCLKEAITTIFESRSLLAKLFLDCHAEAVLREASRKK